MGRLFTSRYFYEGGSAMTSQSVSLATPSVNPQPRQRTMEQQQRFWGWIFISPWIIGFLAFTAFPMIASLVFSFTNFKIGQPLEFTGMTNWNKLISDPVTLNSLGVTLKFGILLLPISLVFPLFMATLLNSKVLLGKPFFRLLFYMPYVVPAISGIFIWQSFLNGQTGYLNRLLRLIGIDNPPNWLFDTKYLYYGLTMIALWGVGNAMLTMMASMQGVPTELYEAASIDGAGAATQWRRITLPLISPVIFYNLVLTAIGLMRYFEVPYVLSNATRSDPSLNFINLHLYRTAFQFQDMGYACALGWFMFAIGLVITITLFATSRRWVYYASGE
jgi:multiple sugar transport system permease protein